MRALLKIAVVAWVVSAACSPSSAQTDFPGFLVSTQWLAQHLDAPDVVVLHIEGQVDRYDAKHIPGARFVAASDISWDGDPAHSVELRPVEDLVEALGRLGVTNDTYVVITGSRTTTTARLWMTLDYLGHGERSALLDGGLQAWEEEGRTLDEGPTPEVAPVQFTAYVREGMQVDAEWIHDRLADASVTLIDARPDDEYTGADGGMGGRVNAGHIPGAQQLYWEDLMVEGNSARFRGEDELADLLAATGVGEGGVGVSYCMVGLRASVNYMAGRMLGYDMKFYDGSWHDWGTRDDLPFVGGAEPGGGG